MKRVIIAALFSIITGVGMASIIRLPSAEELSGSWRLSGTDLHCDLVLHTTPLTENTWRLEGDVRCLQALLAGVPVGWRPTPDGITLTREQGRTVAFFSRIGDRYEYRLPDGGLRVMHKQP